MPTPDVKTDPEVRMQDLTTALCCDRSQKWTAENPGASVVEQLIAGDRIGWQIVQRRLLARFN